MKRWILAVGALLAVGVLAAHADYVIIKINLATAKDIEKAKEREEQQKLQGGQGQLGGLGGGLPGGGMPGMGGAGQGMGGRGGGMPGMGGIGQGMGGRGGGMPGMGGIGQGGRGPGGGGLGGGGLEGAPPGMGGGRGFGPGGMGQAQGMGQGGGKSGGGGMGQGPGGMMGGMMGGGMGSMMSVPGDEEELDSIPVFVGAIMEVENANYKGAKGEVHASFSHKWGRTHLPFLSNTLDIIWVHNAKLKTVPKRYQELLKDIKEDDPNRAGKLLDLAHWSLEHGLVEKVPDVMKELANVDGQNKAVLAFQKISADIENSRKTIKSDAATTIRNYYPDYKFKVKDHYALLHDGLDDADADRWLARLELNYTAFYYWFATHGTVLKVPADRLVAVVINDSESFKDQQRNVFDNAVSVNEGFYARRENLAVFSANRLDEGYIALKSVTGPQWQLFKRENALKGGLRTPQGMDRDYVARVETTALVMKAMEDEAERAAVTHEGTRQLVVAAGMLPRNVAIPNWLDYGLASFFETPKGSYWSGAGGSNMFYHARYKAWDAHRSLEKPPELLKSIVSDKYFREAPVDIKKPEDAKKRESAMIRGRTTAWALSYFLARQKRDGLRKYFDEFNNLPRDLEIDDDALQLTFAQAFGLVSASDPNQIDATRWASFANEFHRFVVSANLEVEDMYREILQSYFNKKSAGAKEGGAKKGTGKQGGGGGSY